MMRNGSVALVMALALGACAAESDPDEQVAQASEVEATQDESSEGEAHEQIGNAGATEGEQGRDESARNPQSDASTETGAPETTGDDETAGDSVVDDEAPVDGKTEQAVQDEPAVDDTQVDDTPTSTDEADDDPDSVEPDSVEPDSVEPDSVEPDAAVAASEDAGTAEVESELQGPDAAPSSPTVDAAVALELSCNELTDLKAEFTDAVAATEDDFSECVYDDECVIFRAEYVNCPAPNDWLLLVGGRSYALSSMQTEAFQSVFDELAGEACPDSLRTQPSCPGGTAAGTVELAACVAGSCAKVISGSNQGNPRPL